MSTDPKPEASAPSHLIPATEALPAVSGAAGTLISAESKREDDEFNIDLMGLWQVLLKRRWTVAGTVGIMFVLALAASLLMTPVYRATASVQIDREQMNISKDSAPVMSFQDPGYIRTQFQVLQSRELASRVLRELGYQNEKRFAQIFPPSLSTQVAGWLKGKPEPGKEDKVEALKKAEVGRVATFQAGFSIEPVRDTRLVNIHYNSTQPEFAIRAVNTLSDAFINRNLEARFSAANYAKNYLEDQLKQLKLKLEDSEAQLVQFAAKEQIVGSGGESSGTLPEQNIGALNAALAKAKEERIRAQSRWEQAQSNIGMFTYGDAGNNSIIKSLQESRAKLNAEYQDKLGIYKPAYPLMLQLKSQIDEVDKQIVQETAAIKQAIRADYLAAQQNENLIAGQIRELKGEAIDLQSRSIQYNVFKREVDTNRQIYDAMLQRYKEIGVAAGVGNNNIAVVDKAVSAVKVLPNTPLNLAIALFLGLVAGVLLALLLEYLDDTLKNAEDIERHLKLPVMGVIPNLKEGFSLADAQADQRSAFSEAYRSVRTALQFSTSRGAPRTLLITSPSPGEGKSTAALTLAQNFAQIGKRILLVDSDMRKPSLHKKMAIDNSHGLSNLLAGALSLQEVIRQTDSPNLSVITTGPLPPNPAELLHDENMAALLAHGLEHFDHIIIDGPPVMGLADAPTLSNMMEGTLIVVHAGATRKALARAAVNRIKAARGSIVGVLINRFEAKHAAYGYGYGYGYGGYSYYTYGASDSPKLGKQ